jgi:hypothetical protein
MNLRVDTATRASSLSLFTQVSPHRNTGHNLNFFTGSIASDLYREFPGFIRPLMVNVLVVETHTMSLTTSPFQTGMLSSNAKGALSSLYAATSTEAGKANGKVCISAGREALVGLTHHTVLHSMGKACGTSSRDKKRGARKETLGMVRGAGGWEVTYDDRLICANSCLCDIYGYYYSMFNANFKQVQ